MLREDWFSVDNAVGHEQQHLLDRLRQDHPDFGPAYFNRGLALARARENSAAVAAFQESLRQNPERIESCLFLANLSLRAGDHAAAKVWLDQAHTLKPGHARIKTLRERAAGRKPQP